MKKSWAVLIAIFLSSPIVYAAQYIERCTPEVNLFSNTGKDRCHVELRGDIVPGDAQALRAILKNPQYRRIYENGVITLNSNGGSVSEAIKISGVLKEWVAQATVEVGDVCASACFLTWLGSPMHFVGKIANPEGKKEIYTGKIGLHRPYFSSGLYKASDLDKLEKAQVRVMDEVRGFLGNQNLSQRLADEMMRRASNDIYWLSEVDREEIGTYSAFWEEVLITQCKTSLKEVNSKYRQNSSDAAANDKLTFLICVDKTTQRRRPQAMK